VPLKGSAGQPFRGSTTHPYRLVVLRLDTTFCQTILEVEATLLQPRVDILPEGEILVVGKYCKRLANGDQELNALVYSSDGRIKRRFSLGDGVEDLQISSEGKVWVSYFDDGTTGDYGARGWGRLSPDTWVDPIGVRGLACYDCAGNRLLSFEPPGDLPAVVDCYALNVVDESAWICYHPEFSLVRVEPGGPVDAWGTDLSNIDAVAVNGLRVLLYASVGAASGRSWVASLSDGVLSEVQQIETRLPEGRPQRVTGRGPFLNLFGESGWSRLALA
jgi:hypothetical protein